MIHEEELHMAGLFVPPQSIRHWSPIPSGQSNLTQGRIAAAQAVVFASWR